MDIGEAKLILKNIFLMPVGKALIAGALPLLGAVLSPESFP